jgi:drug/metabolite transporter (DMT)-like permease
MSFITFAWIASIVFGLEVVIGKLASKYAITNPWMFNFAWSVFYFSSILPFALANGVGLPTHWGNVLWASLFSTLFGFLYIWAMFKLDVSIISPLFNFRTAFAAILGVLLLGEVLTSMQWGLIGTIFVAGMLVSLDERLKIKSFFQWPIAVIIGSMMILALMSIYMNKAFAENGYWEVTLWTLILTSVFTLPTVPLFLKDIRRTHVREYAGVAVMGLFGAMGTIAANLAYKENVSITSAIISIPFSMIFAFFLSRITPKLLEKHTLGVYVIRFTAAAVMIGAALKLSF